MTGVLSKYLFSDASVPLNCYETFHTWTPHCTEASLDILLSTFRETLKIYAVINFVSFLLRRKFSSDEVKECVRRTVRSAAFVATAAGSVFGLFCLARNLTGTVNYSLNTVHMPILAGLAGILIENPRRRTALSLFALNLASEITFNRVVDRGWLKPIANGEVYLFMASLATFVYLSARRGQFERDPIGMLCSFVLQSDFRHGSTLDRNGNKISQQFSQLRPLAIATDIIKATLFGYAITTCLSLATRPKAIKSLDTLLPLLTSERPKKFSLFLGTLCGLYKLSNLTLMKARNRTALEPSDYLLSSFVAGSASYLFKSSTLTLYLFWRAIQAIGASIADRFQLSDNTINCVNNSLFAIACGHVFYSLPFEQRYIRRSYMNFLDRVTDGRVYTFNQVGWNFFGTPAHCDLKNFKPLDYRYLSRQYIETTLVWMI